MLTTYNLSVRKILSSCSVDPEWQRNANLWPSNVVHRYLEDVIGGKPIAPLLVYRDKKLKKRVVLDGKQRVSNLRDFLKSKGISKEDKKAVNDYEFAVVEYPQALFSDTDNNIDLEKVVEFFHKTNSLGTKLTAQEIRRALHINKDYIRFVKQARDSALFQDFLYLFEITDTDSQRMRLRFWDEEFILKTLGYYYLENFNQASYSAKVIDELVVGKTYKELNAAFSRVFETMIAFYDDDSLGEVKFTSKYKGIMPMLIGVVAQYEPSDLQKNAKAIKAFIEDFWMLSHQEIAQKNALTFNSGSGFYRAICSILLNRMDSL